MVKKRSYTPRVTPDGATEHVVKSSAAPTASEKQEIAKLLRDESSATLLPSEGAGGSSLFECRDGSCRVKQLSGPLSQYCSSFGECGECSCSVCRLRTDEPRTLFRRIVVERELGRVPTTPPTVRAVSIGCGGLLTDFEILLELWCRGCTIELFVAIDTSYAEHSKFKAGHMESLAALARFFAPSCKVFSFSSSDDYIAAARSHPERYGRATMFLHCDVGEVEDVQYKDAAATALLPGCLSYELWNAKTVPGTTWPPIRPPLEPWLPEPLRASLDLIYGRSRYSLGVLCRRAAEEAEQSGASAGFGASLLEQICDDPSLANREQLHGPRLVREAVSWLASNARKRAAKTGKRLFRVVSDEAAVRAEPSHDAKIIAPPRAMDDEVIVEEVSLENDHEWVRISPSLDTREGYELYDIEIGRRQAWILASDLREVVLNGDSGETPEVCIT